MEKDFEVANKIRSIRQRRNLSQRRFGIKIGVSGKTISAYEKGRCSPSLRILDSISQVYDVTFLHLKKGKGVHLKEKLAEIKRTVEEIEDTFITTREE